MVNIAKRTLRDDQHRFVAEIAFLLAPWGVPASSGRVYGYILLNQKPVRLQKMAKFYLSIGQAMEATIQEMNGRRAVKER